jgi:hypothetical protein
MTTSLQDFAAIASVILLGLTSLILLMHLNWRWTLIALGVQYLAAAWLVTSSWPLALAAIKLVVGWMAGAVLATSQAGTQLNPEHFSGRLFRVIAAILILVVILILAPGIRSWLQVGQTVVLGGLVLCGMGLLQTSMSREPSRMVVGLLSFLAGFEVIYAALEMSVLVAGLLAAINLGLALAGAYLSTVAEDEGPV